MANLFLIKDLCAEKNISFRELCRMIGKQEGSMYTAVKRGSTKTETIEDIARVLDVPPAYFFDGYLNDKAIDKYRKEIDHLKELLAEKERTIQILMEERKLYLGKK